MNLDLPDPLFLIISLGLLALVPFIAVMATSFVKIAVVLALVRNALGVQQIPPNIALHGIAIVLTLYIMAPVGYAAYEVLSEKDFEGMTLDEFGATLDEASVSFREFLSRHASQSEKDFFVDTARKIWPEEIARDVTHEDIRVLVPAFTVSELKTAFEVGFLLYLPFIAVDLVISNILLAMGMMMVSPMTISLPFKLLLFVLLDGWTRLLHGLVLTYQ
jgi:type III secretion protein R